MGEVYRAKDTRLKRDVAIKVVPERLAKHRDALNRFEREAQAVAALSHPNIVAIHDTGTEGNISFVVMELLEGETLRDRLARSAMPWREAVETAIGVSDGLAAAHAKGVIHRDLKPENVFLTKDGVVKILDFGLARMDELPMVETDAGSPTITLETKPGTVLGTVTYMSPEQVRGRKTDARSDVFSFGCVMYEMVTGRRAFSGDSAPETMTAILKHHPPAPAESGVKSPLELDRVVRRCLEKKPEQRFQSSGDLAFTLRTILSDSGVSATTVGERAPQTHRPVWAVAGLAVVAVFVGLFFFIPRESSAPIRPGEIKMLTSFVGVEESAGWSPDGNFVAYSHNESGPADIYIMSTAGGPPRPVVQSPADDLSPRWSPDGRWLAFVSGRGSSGGIYLVPPLGGAKEEKLVDNNISCVARLDNAAHSLGSAPWSPDSRELLFSRLQSSGELAVWKVDLTTRQPSQLTHPPAKCDDLSATWSFDGKWIAFERRQAGRGSLWLMPTGGGEARPLLADEHDNSDPAWGVDSKSIVFTSSRAGPMNIWEIDITSPRPRRLTTSTIDDTFPAVASNGRIVYNQFSHQTDLYVMSVPAATQRRLTFNTKDNFAADFSPDGRRIAYHSTRTWNFEIWLLDRDTGDERQLTNHPGRDLYPDWSPDGRQIVFVSDRDGDFHLWLLNTDGGGVRRLSGQAVSLYGADPYFVRACVGPRWSPDGKVIGYLASSDEGISLWLMDPDGRNPRAVLHGVESFDWYLDSRRVIYTGMAVGEGTVQMRAVHLETGREVTLLEEPHTELIVRPDGGAVAYLLAESHYNLNLHLLPLAPPDTTDGLPRPSGRPEQLTKGFSEGSRWHAHNGGWSPDGAGIVYTRDTDAGNLYVIENDQE